MLGDAHKDPDKPERRVRLCILHSTSDESSIIVAESEAKRCVESWKMYLLLEKSEDRLFITSCITDTATAHERLFVADLDRVVSICITEMA